MSGNAKVIGIDLGTTNSVVAVMEGGTPVVIPNAEGSRVTPSVVAFQENGERLVGHPARRQAITNARNTIYSVKRFMGRRHVEVDEESKRVAYEVTGAGGDLVKIKADGKEYTPPEISAMVLRSLKETAEAYLGTSVARAVITVPAYFNDSQRQATKDAGKIAGLEVERIINEPTAAALAYGLDKNKSGRIAVFDLGGGTFDISLLDVGDGVFEVLSTAGDSRLGGDDFDEALIDYLATEFQREHAIDLRQDVMALQRLRDACEKAKCELSSATQTAINLPFITADASGPKHLQQNITRAKFEALIEGLLQRCRVPCEQALKDAKLNPSAIDDVILVGGSTRVPAVGELVKTMFGREPNRGVNPDEVVALGAAIQGAVLSGDADEVVLLDVTPLSLGIETKGSLNTKLIERNTTIPVTRKEIFSTASDSQTQVEIHVLQGEREFAADNRTLGRFKLDGIPPAPMGVPQIEVEFNIDANGILHVRAQDKATGKEQSIQIESSSGLSSDEVERMRKAAEEHSESDKKRREVVELQNQADQLLHTMEKLLKEKGDEIPAEEKQKAEEKMEALRKVKDSDDAAALQKAMEELTQASHQLSAHLYQQAQGGPDAQPQGAAASPPPGGGASNGKGDSGDEKIVDAEFEVKD